MKYGDCFFVRALENLGKKRLSEAAKDFELATTLSPLSAIYRERLCYTYKITSDPRFSDCDKRLDELIAGANQQYYLFKFAD
jgi:hypothetical protein